MVDLIQIPQCVVSQESKQAAWHSRKLLAALDYQWPSPGRSAFGRPCVEILCISSCALYVASTSSSVPFLQIGDLVFLKVRVFSSVKC